MAHSGPVGADYWIRVVCDGESRDDDELPLLYGDAWGRLVSRIF